MARIAGVVLPQKKRIEIALTYIYGIGKKRSNEILKKIDVDKNIKTDKLTEDDERKLKEIIAGYLVEGDLRRKIQEDINRLQRIGSYRGIRHKKKLPVRGQRTKTNAKTRKGRGVPIAGKKKQTK